MNTTVFLLGGKDAEMVQIERHLKALNVPFFNKNLGWGAKLSSYQEEIASLPTEVVLVTVELEQDITPAQQVIVVDHHNEMAGKPASILQVLELLCQEPSREDLLIAANDVGFIPALLGMGATAEEIQWVRAQDRAAQGITEQHEQAAEEALSAPVEYVGTTRVFNMKHSKCAPLLDRLAIAQIEQGKSVHENYLIICGDGEINYYGPGATVVKLSKAFPKGWFGGNLPTNGFWGGYESVDAVKAVVNT